MEFVDLIVTVHQQLDDAGIAHAFGGALSLGYAAEPRGTKDIDVNVFVAPERLPTVEHALSEIGFRRPDADGDAEVIPVAGVRFEHITEPFPIDVFCSIDDRYREIEGRVTTHPFGRNDEVLPFLSAEDLCVFKLSFNRAKDWLDLAEIARAQPDLDVDLIEELVVALRGPTMYPRVARLRSLMRST